ncbi:MBL fold metallo-hydrolase [Chitinophaga pendula]|uniref:MBL fold metallo-hydrolase n=1 Tax=Chitinophaga TaxID=79328 RepID=UPI000BAFB76D|nr:MULTISPECIES: MBL fold metallo-hydrolase [Chitinophaga]ASZ09486.1 polyketide synthase [Chitinophaga sp. MD30]UCJ07584.1 MBL fold metallo-hydrolase [Chitinophaga pendula]
MTMDEVYLKPNTVIEPLFKRWYAWSHLISPATAAMNVVGRHMKIMDSYIQAPAIHAAAARNAKMKGGPFMDYQENRVEDIKRLREATQMDQAAQIKLVAAIRELNALLKREATGYGMEALYDKVPASLKGYVELVYDLENNPSFRLFEPLLYQSEYYDESAQSIALWITNNDERPFCLSTPRLDEPHVLHLPMPFRAKEIDELASAKRKPASYKHLADIFGITPAQEPLFRDLFVSTPPTPYNRYTGDKIRMRYFGHACILIETNEVSILLDPLISYYGYEHSISHYSDYDLPEKIDYVLITHNHQDHILFETLLPLRHKIGKLVVPRSGGGSLQDPSLELMFRHTGFDQVISVGEMENIQLEDNLVLTGIPFTGEHSDLDIRSKLCYHVKAGQFSILFVADSRIVTPELYHHIYRQTGDVDVIFLGMECDGAPLSWLYGPLLQQDLARDKDASRRLSGSDYERGMHLVDIFHPKEIYVYAMGQEPWLEFISSIKYTDESNPIVQSNKLIRECESKGIVAERLYGEKELLYNYELV